MSETDVTNPQPDPGRGSDEQLQHAFRKVLEARDSLAVWTEHVRREALQRVPRDSDDEVLDSLADREYWDAIKFYGQVLDVMIAMRKRYDALRSAGAS